MEHCCSAGANVIVSGTAITCVKDAGKVINDMRELAISSLKHGLLDTSGKSEGV